MFWLRSWLCCPGPCLMQGCCEYTATQSQQLLFSSPCLTFSPLRDRAGFLSWFRLCSALREGSTAEVCSGQASSTTENVCLTVGPLNMDPLTEVRPREQRFWWGESYSRSLNLKTLSYQRLSWCLLKFNQLNSINKLTPPPQACSNEWIQQIT